MTTKKKMDANLRAFQIIKTINALTKELDALRPYLNMCKDEFDVAYVNAGLTECLTIGDGFNRAIDKDKILSHAETIDGLKDALISIALNKLGTITIREFDELVKQFPDISDAEFMKEVRHKLTVLRYNGVGKKPSRL